LLRGMAYNILHENGRDIGLKADSNAFALPPLPTVFEASLFATVETLPDFSSANWLGSGWEGRSYLEQAERRIWGENERQRRSRTTQPQSERDEVLMEKAGENISEAAVVPIGLFEPWKHLSPHVLHGQFMNERCPHLRRASPPPSLPLTAPLDCSVRLRLRRCSHKGKGNDGNHHLEDSPGTSKHALTGNIVYFSSTRRAGARDVRSTLRQLGNFASSLCAHLVVPPPGRMLNAMTHNEGVQIPDGVPHSDYFNMTSRMDWGGGRVHKEWSESGEPVILGNVTVKEAQEYGTSGDVDLYLETTGNSAFAQYTRALDAVNKGQTFVWGIHESVYNLRDAFLTSAAEIYFWNENSTFFPFPLLNDLFGGCDYVEITQSNKQERAVQAFLDRAGMPFLPDGSGISGNDQVPYTPLHIRRGDLAHTCNSSLAALESYLNCSYSLCPPHSPFGNLTVQARKPIVLFTNEQDPSYVASVLELVREYAPNSVHGDAVLKEVLYSDGESNVGDNGRQRRNFRDNFFLFSVADIIMNKVPAKKRLVRHRSQCNACDHIC